MINFNSLESVHLKMKEFVPSLGVDGCQAGWISVESGGQKACKIMLFRTIQELWSEYKNIELILVDIPIGLREKGSTPRLCDIAARKLLTRKRSSSIFPTPCRAALYARSYLEANQINKDKSSKGLSKQTWNICGKIREVDILLKNDARAREVFVESMPELCFFSLAKGKPMQNYKKTREGIEERLSILYTFCNSPEILLKEILQRYSQEGIIADDVLDALALSITAAKGKSNLYFIPPNYEHDAVGLPMRIGFLPFK